MSHQLRAIPTMDTTPTGRALPYIPEPAREHPEHITPADTTKGVDWNRLVAELPDVVDQAMQETLPGHYSPEKAASIAAGLIRELQQYRMGVAPQVRA
ncbi:hypothetical protein [Streptomyces griseosporeus]|uniref:hypothetical protein n=1 Tax=Streptomyces griseosporeus TaxID=1910 RepID=UPI00167EF5B6|nr:hypothetical protein [Streptomyces griseosporeus]GHF57691.1 hypothetical protein GCM10018783_28830 [Streptomyces griseosporeus]